LPTNNAAVNMPENKGGQTNMETCRTVKLAILALSVLAVAGAAVEIHASNEPDRTMAAHRRQDREPVARRFPAGLRRPHAPLQGSRSPPIHEY